MTPRCLSYSAIAALAAALALTACKKEAETEAPAPVPAGGEKSGGKVAHVILAGDPVIVPGAKLRFTQTLKMSAANFSTTTAAGTSQGAISLTDTEVREIEFLSDREQLIEIVDKRAKGMMATGGPEPAEAVVKSTLIGQKISAKLQKDGSWWYGIKGGDATSEQTKELQNMKESEALVAFTYPKDPVTIGEEWEAGVEAVEALLGSAFEATEARVRFRLNGIKTFDGQRCAEIDVRLETAGQYLIGDLNLPVHSIIDMNGTLLHSLNTFQDLSISMSGILTMEHHPADGAKVSTDGNIEFNRENRLSK